MFKIFNVNTLFKILLNKVILSSSLKSKVGLDLRKGGTTWEK
jgi:hypothetical protein